MKKIIVMGLLMAGLVVLAQESFAQTLQIKGSDTLINMVQKMAEIYMQNNPGKYVSVTGGGSGTGVAALINKKCDIANASRNMKTKEIEQAKAVGVDPRRVVVAMDGLCVVVNGNNPVKKLTVEDIGKMFRGEITNWSQVGGSDMPVTLYGRQSNSGTYAFLMEVVLKGDYSSKMNQMNGNAQIVEAIKSDPTGIGYVGVGYAKESTGITVLDVAARPGSPYANPLNQADIDSGVYPLIRPLNQYLNGVPKGAVRDFIAFELSPEGQKIVEEEGFFAIPEEYVKFNQEKAGM